MNVERLIAGLDIGSAKTTAVIAEVVGDLPRNPSIRILGVGQARTTGLRRGVVSDIEETTRSIQKAMTDAERMAGAQIADVYSGIAGEHVQAMTSKGIVAISGDEITKADVDRANAVARAQAIPQDRELLHAIPQEYTVDKNHGIRDPIGMIGTRLETEMYLVTIGSSPAMNLRKAAFASAPVMPCRSISLSTTYAPRRSLVSTASEMCGRRKLSSSPVASTASSGGGSRLSRSTST